MFQRSLSVALLAMLLAVAARAQAADPLPSWNDGAAKARIVAFVEAVTQTGGKDFVAPADRVAVFDNDGTLWSEQPMYSQLAFAIDRARAMVAKNPALASRPSVKAAAAGDMKALAATGEKGLLELVALTHAGNTSEEFAQIVGEWIKSARHPTFKRPYTELTYKPMRELLDYLRANGFKTWIVSGGGIEFLRVMSEELYGVPPEQVVGSSIKTRYEVRNGKPAIVRLPEIDFIDDKAGKPVGIHKFIGRRPIAAFGNSDGDFEMLEWTTTGPGPRLGVIVHHDDAQREFAYDRASHVGKLVRGLDEGPARGWTIVSVKNDWKQVYFGR
ncbi:MAG: haloacid dehalogenase-like hydrolase [Burkholderiales bacterium]|nr:MAG: haloacid dehalogenase-like hydrolase [Burkholderiales bacterium]